MNLWRLEWVRLVRSRRLVALVGVYVFFGLVGPTTARYIGEIVERFGSGITVQFPEPVPADGIAQFTSNAHQIGLLVAVVVAAGALVIDAIPEMSIFLRTRVRSTASLLTPRLVVSYAAIGGAFLAGLGAAHYQTTVLLGAVSSADMAIGAGFTLVYLAFVVALVAAIGSRSSGVLPTVAISVVALLVLPVLGIVDAIGRWLPSHLLGSLDGLLRSTSDAADYLPATAVTVVLTVALVALARHWAGRREL